MPRPDSPPVTKGVVLRSLGFGLAVILGAIAVWLIVTGTNSPKRIEIGVLAGLWGLLLGAYTMFGSRRLGTPGDFGPAPTPAPTGSDVALRSAAEVERVAEAAVRRVFEEQLEGLLSRYINSSMSREVSELRDEISRLRQDLVEKVGGQLRLERIETTRLIGSDLEALQHEVRKLTVANEGVGLDASSDQTRVTSVRQIVEPARVRPISRSAADVEADVQPALASPPAVTPPVPVALQKDPASQPTKAASSADGSRSEAPPSLPVAADARSAEVRSSEPTVEAAKAQAARAEAAKAEAAKAEARKADSRKTETARLAAAKADEAKFEARRVEAAKVEAMRLEAQRAEAARLEARKAEVAKAEAAQRELRRAEGAKAEAARLEAQRAEAARLDARQAEVAKAEAARAQARRLSGARAAHASPTDETGPLGPGLPPIRSAAQRAAANSSRHGSSAQLPAVETQVPPVREPAAQAPAAQIPAEPAASAQPEPSSIFPSRSGASDDPFASLPRITPFTEFALDPIETPTNGKGSTTNGNHGSDTGPVYTGRRRRDGEPAPIPDDRGRHSRGEIKPEPAPTGRRRRADENDDGEDLLARLLARNNADH